MKQSIFKTFFLTLIFSTLSFAQLNIGYVDSEAIIKQLPDAQDAQKRIDTQIEEWQKEIRKMEDELRNAEADFERRKLLMGKQKRVETEKELKSLKEKIESFRNSKFGANGELFKKQEEFMKPIQNRIFNAIEEIALDKDLDFVFDRSGDLIFLYAKEEYDITGEVLAKLQ